MLVPDTDILSLVQAGRGLSGLQLKERIAGSGQVPYVTIVTLQEQMTVGSVSAPEQERLRTI